MPWNACGMTHQAIKLKITDTTLVKLIYLSLLILIATGCASSSNNENNETRFPNLVTLQQPDSQSHQPSRVYIDSVKKISSRQNPSLLISGTFPDGCTKLKEVSHHIEKDSLFLHFKSWRNPDTMCSQVLTPFSFIYDKLTQKEITAHSNVIINATSYSY